MDVDQLKITRSDDGEPSINCPRCEALIQPEKNILFEGWDCPECQGSIDGSTLRKYLKVRKRWEACGYEPE